MSENTLGQFINLVTPAPQQSLDRVSNSVSQGYNNAKGVVQVAKSVITAPVVQETVKGVVVPGYNLTPSKETVKDIKENGPLGHVSNGWFSKLAHGAEDVGSITSEGEMYYKNADKRADEYIDGVNDKAVKKGTEKAIAGGATPDQAKKKGYEAGSNALGGLIHPKSFSETTNLFVQGAKVANQAYDDTQKQLDDKNNKSLLGQLIPLLVGAGILGAGYLATDTLNKPSYSL